MASHRYICNKNCRKIDMLTRILACLYSSAPMHWFIRKLRIQNSKWNARHALVQHAITILMHITYKVNVEYDATNHQSSRVLKEVHYYMSDDKTHNSLFVQHIFTLHWGYMKSKRCFPKQHLVWSDGCSTQFKCARAWYFVACYPWLTICDQRPEGVQMCWNYFASSHGKGKVDGAGALLKCEIRKEHIKAQA